MSTYEDEAEENSKREFCRRHLVIVEEMEIMVLIFTYIELFIYLDIYRKNV